MKTAVVFARVIGKPEYDGVIRRWLASYLKHLPAMRHELVVINRYHDSPDDLFDTVADRYLRYDGGGWDCGSWQFAGLHVDADLLVCMNSSTYVKRSGWLERLVEAVEQHGTGLYGPLASFECSPHIRTPCLVFQPEVINGYPQPVNTRDDTWDFEHRGFPSGVPQFTTWCRFHGYKTTLVTWDGCYPMFNWRYPRNIFRRGNQSNCVVWDRHCDTYTIASPKQKQLLRDCADGKHN